MTFLLLSMCLVAITAAVVRPAMVAGHRPSISHLNGIGVLSAFVATVTVAVFLGIELAVALLAAWWVKEIGHVLGYRLAGHDDARFRLMPLPRGPAISDHAPSSDLAAFFILLMGPGFSLAPMVAAFAIGDALAATAPGVSQAARSFALAAGGLNFLALLPLWPLPGGRLVQFVVQARFPRVSGLAAAALAAFLVGMSFTVHSLLLFLLGLVSAFALIRRQPEPSTRPRLTRAQIRIGFTAYFATLSAFFLGGWWVLRLLPPVF